MKFLREPQIQINEIVLQREKKKKLAKLYNMLIPAYNYIQLSEMQWSVARITVSLFAYKDSNSCIPSCKEGVL